MWIAGPALLVAVVLVASIIPARWALAVNPLSVTRES
jgi:ABC-type lipoprotein release transport system permease subunit